MKEGNLHTQTHQADLVRFGPRTYVNTGNWIRDFDYAALEDGRFELRRFA